MKEEIFMVGTILISSSLIGSCIYDRVTAKKEVVEVTIIDKRYVPGHYEEECSTQHFDVGDVQIPITSCHQEWYQPVWEVTYFDENSRHLLGVSGALYDLIQLNDTKFLSFERGGFYGMRYKETFLLKRPNAESEF